MDLFDIAVARKLSSGGGGGGGSSDFSTAEVTVTVPNEVTLIIPWALDEGDVHTLSNIIADVDSETINIVMYKGRADAFVWGEYGSIVVTGDILEIDGEFIITGNGTITVSNSGGGDVPID